MVWIDIRRPLLLLLASPSNTLLECRSNQRIRPKTDSHVPKCGVPWLPLIEFRDELNGPGKSQGHCGRIPQISWVAHSSISLLRSQLRTFLKDMINRLLTLPIPSASRVNLWAETTLIWAEGKMMPTSQASKMHSFLSMQVCLIWIHRWWGLSQKSVIIHRWWSRSQKRYYSSGVSKYLHIFPLVTIFLILNSYIDTDSNFSILTMFAAYLALHVVVSPIYCTLNIKQNIFALVIIIYMAHHQFQQEVALQKDYVSPGTKRISFIQDMF